MSEVRRSFAFACIALIGTLVGCGTTNSAELSMKAEELKSTLTWHEAKATTQAMELEIVSLVPKELVVRVEQMKDGTLFSCDAVQHRWKGATTVVVIEDTDIQPIVKTIEEQYMGSRFQTGNRLDVIGKYEVSLSSPETAEHYLIGEDLPNTIRIASGSACFTLPEGTYPGGEW